MSNDDHRFLCEEYFPEKYGEIIDFIYAYEGESGWFDKVMWLPEEHADLLQRRENANVP